MRTVCKLNQCAGCMACLDICHQKAIQIIDSLDAYNAVIDKNLCIACGACYKVCQANHHLIGKYPLYWKEGWAKDATIRQKSSSGGFATAIEVAFVNTGGIVCSCSFSEGKFGFSFAETEEDVKHFTGSKYVKSNPEGVYKQILMKLQIGKKVLFVGLPCQIAAVLNYVGNQENLYTIDLICHGSPSPRILELFLKDYRLDLDNISDITFRTKGSFHLEQNQKQIVVPVCTDRYTQLFLNSTTYTENCYNCYYAKLERVSDITLGDSWGSELDSDIQEQGVSLALCQTKKGWDLLNESNLLLLDVDLERSVEYNHQLEHPSKRPIQRVIFFDVLKKRKRFKKAMLKAYPKLYVKAVVKTALYKIGILKHG